MTSISQIVISVLLGLLLTVIYLIYTWMKKKKAKKLLETENKGEGGKKYTDLDEFIYGLPNYCIQDDPVSSAIRRTMEKIGVEYQQRVFIDTKGGNDKTVWMRKKGNSFIHEKGVYCDPIFYNKPIVYHFKDDLRPVVDMADDANWKNPMAVARYVYSLVNTADQEAAQGNESKMTLIIAGVLALLIIVNIILVYNNQKIETERWDTLYGMIKQYTETKSGGL